MYPADGIQLDLSPTSREMYVSQPSGGNSKLMSV
jgi:hypothetical protein